MTIPLLCKSDQSKKMSFNVLDGLPIITHILVCARAMFKRLLFGQPDTPSLAPAHACPVLTRTIPSANNKHRTSKTEDRF